MTVDAALHRLASASLVALIALLMAWVIWLAPPPASLVAPLLLLLVGPLALALRGVLHARRYTLAWTTLLILFYFVHGVAYAAGTGVSRWLGAAEIVLALIYFASAASFMRRTRARANPPREPGG
jgi:uncharacterized membrane protein